MVQSQHIHMPRWKTRISLSPDCKLKKERVVLKVLRGETKIKTEKEQEQIWYELMQKTEKLDKTISNCHTIVDKIINKKDKQM